LSKTKNYYHSVIADRFRPPPSPVAQTNEGIGVNWRH